MCHPDGANTHPETYPKFQTQLQRVALLRDMINWCIENPVKGKPAPMIRGCVRSKPTSSPNAMGPRWLTESTRQSLRAPSRKARSVPGLTARRSNLACPAGCRRPSALCLPGWSRGRSRRGGLPTTAHRSQTDARRESTGHQQCDEHARVYIDAHRSSSLRRFVKSTPASCDWTASPSDAPKPIQVAS